MFKFVAICIYVSILLTAVACAAVANPDGGGGEPPFPEIPPAELIDRVSSYIAGRTIDAQCALDEATWAIEVEEYPGAVGLYTHGTDYTRLAPWVCDVIEDGPEGRYVGYGLNIVIHEAVHAAGERDEAVTACRALELMPVIIDTFYPYVSIPVAAEIEAQGRAMHEDLTDEYRTLC